ncbi:MAG: YegS/Rv2252/BmrU family lipid kinase [Eubacteriales bacterium]|nr:YegS/Rv2252/BmrU family lipid kinase [Eubacteriales bacterium]
MEEKRLLFIFNPKAGKGQIRNHLLDIIDIFVKAGYEVTARPTQYAGEAAEIAAEAAKKYDLVVCSGGDGTLDEVVTGIMKTAPQVPVGYIPAGSTNDFANSLRIPKSMKRAAEAAVSGELYACDVGAFNDSTFVYIAAFGLFTDVSYETRQEMKNVLGHMAYILEGMKKLAAVKSYHMKITTQDTVIEDDFLYGMVTNSTSVGGFRGITGKFVNLSDGVFEVTLVKRPKNLEDLNQILGALTMRDIDAAQMYCFKTSRIKFETDEELAWTLDGEFGGKHTEVVIENRKQALKIMTPATAEDR